MKLKIETIINENNKLKNNDIVIDDLKNKNGVLINKINNIEQELNTLK